MTFKQYDPDQISIIFGDYEIIGYADGEFVTIDNMSDAFTDVVGTDGQVSRSKGTDRRATVVFKLMQTSESNAILSQIHNADRDTPGGAGVLPIKIMDRIGGATYQGEHAWIVKAPAVSLDRSPTSREWTVRVARLERVDQGG